MATEAVVEPYKLSEIFSIIPEYDGNQIFLQTYLNSVRCAYGMSVGNQKVLLTLHVKNKLRGKAAEIINSRNPSTWEEIKVLLETHFGDSRDLTALIQDLQRISQNPNEPVLNFISRLQTHNAKMHAAIQKQQLTAEQKVAQSNLIETMTLNTLLTGLDPKLSPIIRASNPQDMLQAISRIKRELQLSYFESQKFNNQKSQSNPPRRPQINSNTQKMCSFCKKPGHLVNECRMRQQSRFTQNLQNFTNQNFQNQNFQNQNFVRPNFQPNANHSFPRQANPQQNNFQNRPSTIRPNPNFNQPRPSIIKQNPNYNPQRTHHVNENNGYSNYYYDDAAHQSQNYQYENYDDTAYQYQYENHDDTAHQYQCFDEDDTAHQYQNHDNNQFTYNETNQDFQSNQHLHDPPDQYQSQISEIQSQFQTMNLNHTPSSNNNEQNFL